jgi:hypothetical protein
MNKERREIELLQRALKCIGESSNEDLCGEIEVFLAQPEQQPEAWIIVNRDTGYRTQVSDLTPFLYHREIFEVIPLYTSPPKREPLGDGITADMYRANNKATHPDSYWAGVYDAEKAHGIGGGE